MTLWRIPKDGELRAVCWDHNTCSQPSICACTCHTLADAEDVVDR